MARYKIVATGRYADGSPVTAVYPNGNVYTQVLCAGSAFRTCRAFVAHLNARYPGTTWRAVRESR